MFFAPALVSMALVCSPWAPPRVIIDENGTSVCHQPPPPGTGLREDGRGIILLPATGVYTFIGGTVNRASVRYFGEASFGSVQATSSRFEWIRPDGVREPVPTRFLYPPF